MSTEQNVFDALGLRPFDVKVSTCSSFFNKVLARYQIKACLLLSTCSAELWVRYASKSVFL